MILHVTFLSVHVEIWMALNLVSAEQRTSQIARNNCRRNGSCISWLDLATLMQCAAGLTRAKRRPTAFVDPDFLESCRTKYE